MMELEACLIYLAACKANLNPSLTPNINAFKFEWLRWHHRKIDDIKCKAIQSAKPLREELKKMITDPVEHLSADTEKEVMGLNIDKVHPDIYMNELLIGMRTNWFCAKLLTVQLFKIIYFHPVRLSYSSIIVNFSLLAVKSPINLMKKPLESWCLSSRDYQHLQ